MTHAGTMDLGRNAQTKQSGSRLPAVMLTLAVVVAAIAAVWFASSAGLVGGTATKPAGVIAAQTGAKSLPDNLSARRGYPIAAQPAAIALPDNLSARRGYAAVAVTSPINLWSWRGHAAGAVTLPDNLSVRRGYAIEAQPSAIKLPDNLSLRGGYWVQIAAPSFSATSGTFHLGR
jgi:hypothetical protein